MRKEKSTGVLFEAATCAPCVWPAAGLLEYWLRGASARLWVLDFANELLTAIPMLFTFFLVLGRVFWAVWLVFVLALISAFWFRYLARRNLAMVGSPSWLLRFYVVAVGRLSVLTILVLGLLVAISWWWLSSGMHPGVSSVFGLAILLLPFRLRLSSRGRGVLRLALMIVVGFVVVLASNLLHRATAVPARGTLVAAIPNAFDGFVMPDGAAWVSESQMHSLWRVQSGLKSPYLMLQKPHRLASCSNGSVLAGAFVNQAVLWRVQVGGKRYPVSNACGGGISDLAADKDCNEVWVLCQGSSSLLRFRNGASGVAQSETLWLFPGFLALDKTTDRVFIAHEIAGGMTILSSSHAQPAETFWRGTNFWGVAHDPRTGLTWVGRPVRGELMAFDGERRVVCRLRVGCAPRYMLLRAEQRELWVGNYISGTLSVVDLDRRQVVRTLLLDRRPLWSQLRVIREAPDGRVLAAKNDGLWLIGEGSAKTAANPTPSVN